MARVLFTGFIGSQTPPTNSQDIFLNLGNAETTPVGSQARVFTVIPQGGSFIQFDQQAEAAIYYLLFGNGHAPAEVNNLQLHVVTTNKQGGGFGLTPPFLSYKVLVQEV